MSLVHAILLAALQGITEFLPISSTAHLILLPYLMGWPDQGLLFDMATHVGTLVAVALYFRDELVNVGRGLPGIASRRALVPGSDAFLALALVVGTGPVLVGALLLGDWVETSGRSPLVIATTSIVFGLLLGLADWRSRRDRGMEALAWRDVIVVGLFQALALIPGTSRSGITITAALFTGLDRTAAARFSFLLSIPVMTVVAAKTGWDIFTEGVAETVGWLPVLVGVLVSAVTAYLVIVGLLRWLQRQSLQIFVIYRVLLGVVILWVVF